MPAQLPPGGLATAVPAWTAHPDVWLVCGLLAALYAIAIVRVGPRFVAPGRAVATRLNITCFSLGVFAILLASDWPIHDIAERYNYSVHMVQHLVFTMIATPLLLLGTPAWLMRYLLPGKLLGIVRALARFVPALLIFNVVLVLTHWPAMVNASLESGWVHFGMHVVLFTSSLIVWLPVVSPLAGDPAPHARDAHAVPVHLVDRAHDPRVVPHVRIDAAVQVLRAPTTPVRAHHVG